jgi:hypothetical protein
VSALLVVLPRFTETCVLPVHGNKQRHDNHPTFTGTLKLLNLHVLVSATADMTVCSDVSGCTYGGEQHFILDSYRNIMFKTSFLHTPVSITKLICAESEIPRMYGKHNSSEYFREEGCVWGHTS